MSNPQPMESPQDPKLVTWVKILALELNDVLDNYELSVPELCSLLGTDLTMTRTVADGRFVGREGMHIYARLHFIVGLYNANPAVVPGAEGDPATPLAWSASKVYDWYALNMVEVVSRRAVFTEVQKAKDPYELPEEAALAVAPTAPLSSPTVLDPPPPSLWGNLAGMIFGAFALAFAARSWMYLNTIPTNLAVAVGMVVLIILALIVTIIASGVFVVCAWEFFRDLWMGHIVRSFSKLRRYMEADSRMMMAVNGVCLFLDAVLLFGVAPTIPVFWLRLLTELVLAGMLIFFADSLFRLRSRNNRQLLYITMGAIGGAIASSVLYFSDLSNVFRAVPFIVLTFAVVALVSWKKTGAVTI